MEKIKSILIASLLTFIASSWAVEDNVKQDQGVESVKLISEKEANSQSDPNFLIKNGLFVEKLLKGNIKKVRFDEVILKNNAKITITYLHWLKDEDDPIYKIRMKGKYYLFKNPAVMQLIQEARSAQDAVKDSNLIEDCKECLDYLSKGK